jgi:uncharacterized protein (DUF4213/DUF364 family)
MAPSDDGLGGWVMGIRQNLQRLSRERAENVTVTDVRIGLRYTAVSLTGGRVGLAYTFSRDAIGGCSYLDGLAPLAGRAASDLLALFDSSGRIGSAVALATANALLNDSGAGWMEGDILDQVVIHPGDTVGMIGYFGPLVPPLKERGSRVLIFEEIDRPQGDLLPEKDAEGRLPDCQIALITATSIANNTIDALLKAARGCREVALLGASTPMAPEVFDDGPVTILAGVVVTKPDEILRIVSEGGGTRQFRGRVRKVNVKLGQPRATAV